MDKLDPKRYRRRQTKMKDQLWIGSSERDLLKMRDEVQSEVGFALYLAQSGAKHPSSKPLKGFGSAGVLEVVEDFDGDSFRAVYTVRFFQCCVRIALPPEEIDSWHRDAQAGYGND